MKANSNCEDSIILFKFPIYNYTANTKLGQKYPWKKRNSH